MGVGRRSLWIRTDMVRPGAFFMPEISERSEMETMPTAVEELRADVIRRVKDEDITFIQLWFTDVVGRLKSFAITQRELEAAITHGMGFDGSSVTGFNAIEESDMIAMPDPTSFRVLPWSSGDRSVA
jgi:hypothetical protein